MNKTAIKNFAIWARNKLIADISYRAGLMGITEKGIADALPQSTLDAEFYDIGAAEPYLVAGDAIKQRRQLVVAIREKEADTDYKTAYGYIIEEVAYTWFNRLIAVRFMEVNDYLPSHLRVLSSESGKVEPDLVTTPFDADLPFTAEEEAHILQWKQDNKLDELFRFLFIRQCNALNEILPGLFEKTTDYTELLLNLSVVDREGVVYKLTHDIPENDFNVEQGGQVEIIGWLYQYYNTEPKAAAFAKNGKITKEEIPAVTQLFTPDWIVRYMVENSLGRIFISGQCSVVSDQWTEKERIAKEQEIADRMGWKYYLPEAEQTPEVRSTLNKLTTDYSSLATDPTGLKLIDPCMGSGHILVYAFDVLMQIYTSVGYSERDAAKSILEHNLYGLDIDDRAYQLAYFAVMMKARQYNRRILNGENTCHVYAIQESNAVNRAHLKFFGTHLSELERNTAKMQMEGLLDILTDAKEYGSILNVPEYNWDLLRRFAADVADEAQVSFESTGVEETAEQLQQLVELGETMGRKYWVTVTNPPYMGSSGMDGELNDFVKENYPDSKSDLSTVCMERATTFCKDNGYWTMINIPVWMFLTSYEKLRIKLLSSQTIVNMVHPGRGIFGSDFGTTTFVFSKRKSNGYKGDYYRLFDKQGEVQSVEVRENAFLERKGHFVSQQDGFSKIPGSPVAYWVSNNIINAFASKLLGDYGYPKQGFATGSNDRYLRLWFETEIDKTGFDCSNRTEAVESKKKWFPCNKGGAFRRWYGNNNYVANWENDGADMRNFAGSVIRNPQFYFQKGITWSSLSNANLSMRYSSEGFIFESKGSVCFMKNDEYLYYILGLMNTKIVDELLLILSPTIDYHEGPMSRVPIICNDEKKESVDELVKHNVDSCKEDWDSFETSWDFKRHPLV